MPYSNSPTEGILRLMHIQNVVRQNVNRQNVPRDKTSQGTKRPKGQNVPGTKRPKGQNVPRDKTSQGTKHPTERTSQWTRRPTGQMKPIIYIKCVAYYLIQYGQDKGMTKPNLTIIRITLFIN